MRAGSRIAALVLFGALFLILSPVQANEDSPGMFTEFFPIEMVGSITLIVGGSTGLVTSLVTFIDIGQNKRPSNANLFFGGAVGLLNGVVGIAYLASSDHDFAVGVGVTHLALGVAGLSAAFWGSLIPEEDDLAVSPMVLPPAPGTGVESAAFGLVVSGRF